MFDVPPNVLLAMSMVIGLLVLATCTRLVLAANFPAHDYTELRQRIQSWWWIVSSLFAVLLISDGFAIAFFAFLSFLALREFLSIAPMRQADRRAVLWAYLAIPIQYYWVYSSQYQMFLVFVPVYLFLFLPLRMVLIGDTNGFIRSVSMLHWAAMLTIFCISHIAYLLRIDPLNAQAGAIGLVLFLLIATEANDIFQFICGKSLGRRKIIPNVSPNKTWEGFLGGVGIVTIGAGLAAPYLTPLTVLQGFVAGLIITVSGFVGDVVLSSVKRDLQIKDSGHLIPGHGGILDRLDSLLFAAPLFFHFVYYCSY